MIVYDMREGLEKLIDEYDLKKKFEVINEVPAEPLTAAQEERLWDYYGGLPEDDEWDIEGDLSV